jgi:hypothetical protein
MKRLLLVCASALALTSMLAVDAYAQRGGRGFGGVGMGGRGFAVGGVGRGVAMGGIGRGVAIGGVGRGIAMGGVARGAIRGGMWRPGSGVAWRPGLRRWGWGFPVAAGIAAGAYYGGYGYDYGYGGYGYGYGDTCLAWNGYQWVNICFQPPPGPPGGGQYLPPPSFY